MKSIDSQDIQFVDNQITTFAVQAEKALKSLKAGFKTGKFIEQQEEEKVKKIKKDENEYSKNATIVKSDSVKGEKTLFMRKNMRIHYQYLRMLKNVKLWDAEDPEDFSMRLKYAYDVGRYQAIHSANQFDEGPTTRSYRREKYMKDDMIKMYQPLVSNNLGLIKKIKINANKFKADLSKAHSLGLQVTFLY